MAVVHLCLDDKLLSRGMLTSKGTIVTCNGKEYVSVSEWRSDVMMRARQGGDAATRLALKKNRIYTESEYVHRSAR